MIRLAAFVIILAAVASCTATQHSENREVVAEPEPVIDTTMSTKGAISGTGTIRFMDFEGGFYGIVADDGQRYDPGRLEEVFQQDGLRVRFVVREMKGVMSVRMWGRLVELIRIEATEE